MPEFLTTPFANGPTISPLDVLVRLTMAMVLGGVVALVYRLTRPAADVTPSFPPTLVLLSILIAMSTQIIGDNVARAFSLVGALSIVRFRTVVRDTQDTAYVIFAVVIGMAMGARDPLVAVIGIVIVGIASWLMRPKTVTTTAAVANASEEFLLTIRVGLSVDLNTLLDDTLNAQLASRRLVEMNTGKQGIAINAVYAVQFRPTGSADALVKGLNRLEGVQSVELKSRDAHVETE